MKPLVDELAEESGMSEPMGDWTADTAGNPTAVVEPGDWARIAQRARDVGARLDWLRGVDGADPVRIAAIYVRDQQWVILETSVARTAPLPSLAAIFPVAAWHERATSEGFGVSFTDAQTLPPVLPPTGAAPLLIEVPLPARQATPWPGMGAKRRGAVPGVRPQWSPNDDPGTPR